LTTTCVAATAPQSSKASLLSLACDSGFGFLHNGTGDPIQGPDPLTKGDLMYAPKEVRLSEIQFRLELPQFAVIEPTVDASQ
jgi:hypothetical protein